VISGLVRVLLTELGRSGAGGHRTDEAALEFWKCGMAQEVKDRHAVASRLNRLRSLRPGLSVAYAGDTLSVLAGHDGYWRLTIERNWSNQQYSRWLTRISSRQLLPDRLGPAGAVPATVGERHRRPQ